MSLNLFLKWIPAVELRLLVHLLLLLLTLVLLSLALCNLPDIVSCDFSRYPADQTAALENTESNQPESCFATD